MKYAYLLFVSSKQTLDQIKSYNKTDYKFGFITDIDSERPEKGLNENIINFISKKKVSHHGC